MTEEMSIMLPGTEAPALMTAEEARACVARIRADCASAAAHIVELRDREGWRVLGYGNWYDCAKAELGLSVQRVFQLAAFQDFSTRVEQIGLPRPAYESQVRRLNAVPEAERVDTWATVAATAPNGKITTSHIEHVVREVVERFQQKQAAREVYRAEVQSLARELDLQPPADEEAENQRIQMTHAFYEAIGALATLPRPEEVFEVIPPYQEYRMGNLRPAFNWLSQFVALWENR